ncbi:MAG: UDP-N-acetylmuramoyl-L-alanyl-D-glutamate--2,6-diaminopimelate ligase [Planctomycetota bacterium]|nr:UDP-N-acetylmuramoyl-L-alanyl-D-glutamate--2,6-diaminopimelate ligase [Planctomycetota bacterium]
MLLSELVSGLSVRRDPDRDARVCDLSEDSRTVVPGTLFIARRGLKADGNAFIEQALRAGASAVLTDNASLRLAGDGAVPLVYAPDVPAVLSVIAERFYGGASSRLSLVGVTGTNGKTTTTYLVWRLLNGAGVRCGLVGTVLVDDGREVAASGMTTPPATETSRCLASMVDAGCAAACMEVSSHALHQRRADALRFRVGVFTNLSGDHLDYHGTMDAYADAKARLFERLEPDALAVVNVQDPRAARMTRDCRARVLRCAVATPGALTDAERGADCVATILDESLDAMRLRLRGAWGEIDARVPLVGRYNAMNTLQACACAHALGLGADALAAGLPGLAAPPGRLERVHAPTDDVRVYVDYAHSDDSLRNVLLTVGAVMPGRHHAGDIRSAAGAPKQTETPSRLWAVFGCGGDRDRTKRPRMGRAAADLADRVVVTSDNPRTERPGDIIDEILAGIPASARPAIEVQADRARAIHHAVRQASPGDVVVIAGKGHETEQILPDGKGGTVRTHFDDREVAREALELRRARVAPSEPAP